jgi:hypothetical protein
MQNKHLNAKITYSDTFNSLPGFELYRDRLITVASFFTAALISLSSKAV